MAQEVITPGHEGLPNPESADIADILLSSPDAAVVVENYETSDGHGHDYRRHLALGRAGDRDAVVVQLCHRRERPLQRDGWEQAIVITYAELLDAVRAHTTSDRAWTSRHPDQNFFLCQLFEHFVEGPAAMNTDDTLAFLTAMCETGESARYGYQPHDRAAEEFGDLIAAHARRQLSESRALMAATKRSLSIYVNAVLVEQLNRELANGPVEEVITHFSGLWTWGVGLRRGEKLPAVFLVFGPTAVQELDQVPRKLEDPDFSQVFVDLKDPAVGGASRLAHTGVSLVEVMDGLLANDVRLRDAVLAIIAG